MELKKTGHQLYVPGASDPYVKVKSGGRLLHKSRTVHRDLNPVWDESVTLPIEDPFQSLTFKVNSLSFYLSRYNYLLVIPRESY